MTNEQLIEKFNPANAANLTPQDFETMRGLTDQQINALAEAYPNKPTRRSYLRLYDTTLPANKQLFQLSTWQNLRNVRKFSNKKNLVPYDFHSTAASFTREARQKMAQGPGGSSPVKKVLVDLTAKEAADELKKITEAQQKAQEPGNVANEVKSPVKETSKTTAPQKSAAKPAANKGKSETPEQVPAPKASIPADQQFDEFQESQPGE